MSRYSSLIDTFMAVDMYNANMTATPGGAVLPPADFNLVASDFVSRFFGPRESAQGPVVGFDPRDNPIIRGLAIYSNLGDCLVDIGDPHRVANFGFMMILKLYRLLPKATGTISNVAGTDAVTGVGTLFSKECAPGQTIVFVDTNDVLREGTILSITSDTALTLTATTSTSAPMFSGNTAGSRFTPYVYTGAGTITLQLPTLNAIYPFSVYAGDVSMIKPVDGTMSVAGVTAAQITAGVGTMQLVGVGTRFTKTLTVGQFFRYGTGANMRTLQVASIASDTLAVLTIPLALNLPAAFAYPALQNFTVGYVDACMALKASIGTKFSLSTINVDPLFANKNIMFHAVAEIEHNRALSQTLE